MKRTKLIVATAIVAGVVGTGSVGCMRRTAEPARVAVVAPRGAHIEAGTKFSGTLNAELSTLRSRDGDRFTITLDENVLANDGSIALPRGSTLYGRVVRVDARKDRSAGDEPPRLAIAIERVTTDRRGADFNAAIIDANGYATVGLADPSKPHDSVFSPPIGPKASFGGGPRTYEGDNAVAPNYQVTIPEGTRLLLIISEPTAIP